MPDLFDLQFLTVIGKGGVGKTTVTAALALAAARRGKRVLVAMCNTKERLSYLLEVPPIDADIVEVLPGIDAVNMTPERAMEEYGLMVLKVRALYRAVFENRFVSAFLRGTPGLEAWSMLGKAYFHANETREDGSRRYDVVILDAPATGHGLDMLRVPKVITEVAPPGLLRAEAEKAMDHFRDRARSGVVLVTLPEEMPTNETIDLHEAVSKELGFPIAKLVVNSVLPRIFDPAERATFMELPTRVPAGSKIDSLARAGRTRATREGIQEANLRRLATELKELARAELPMLFAPEFRRAEVESLSHAF